MPEQKVTLGGCTYLFAEGVWDYSDGYIKDANSEYFITWKLEA